MTVYRRPQVMRPGKEACLSEQNYVWQGGPSNVTCSGSIYQIIIRFRKNTPWVPRKIVLEAHDILRHGYGARLENRFGHMMNVDGFHD